jgi:hypothetical protein
MKRQRMVSTLLTAILILSSGILMAQSMKTFDWDSYKTSFSVPQNFRVTKSSSEYWSGTNDDITMSIYPRKDENLTQAEMKNSVYKWAVDNNIKDIGTATELNADKLNGYWGVMFEGTIDGFPVATMLIVNPKDPNISLYIWISYRDGFEDTVIKMLMSYTPVAATSGGLGKGVGETGSTMKSFTWDSYKTKFSVPQNFSVSKSTSEYWEGTNSDITMSIYPRKGENLTRSEMKNSVYKWALDNGVKNIGDATELNSDKLNGYWGVMYEGTIDDFAVSTMLVVDPDYPDISLYIWVSYRAAYEDTVLKMLMSFTPN